MEKLVFKNMYLNIVFGAVLVLLALMGYFMGLIEDYLPIVIGVVLVLLSVKRFWFSFKKTISKNGSLILVIELILDLIFAGLLIYLQDHVELFIGLIIYTRGVAYLIINYVATRKVKIMQYLINILYVTFGSFLIFTSYSSTVFLSIFISALMLLVGAIYLQAGIKKIVLKEEQEEAQAKKEKEDQKLKKVEAKSETKIDKLENKVKEVEQERKKVLEEKKDLEKKVQKLEPKIEKVQPKVVEEKKVPKVEPVKEAKLDYEELTVTELRALAKKRNIVGVSQLKKAELIEKLKVK